MLLRQVLLLPVLTLCMAAEKENEGARKTRNPGLLHLAHAGDAVGSYIDGSPRVSTLGTGGAHVVILGGEGARVSTHVASKDSLEEIEADLRQHYGGSPLVRYVPNTSYKGHLLDHAGRSHLNFLGVRERTYGHAFPGPILGHHPGIGIPGHGVGYKLVPLQHVLHNPSHTQVSTVIGHPSSHYGSSPTPHTQAHSVTPTPLSHTLATPLQHHSGYHLQHLPLGAHHGFQSPLGQPVFLPVPLLGGHHTAAFQPSYGLQHPQTSGPAGHSQSQHRGSEGEGRHNSEYFNSGHGSSYDDDYPKFSDDVQERRAGDKYMEHRDFESGSVEKSGSEERVSAKSAPSVSSSFEDSSSGEKRPFGSFKFKFSDDFGIKGRSFPGEEKVATSYQSVVIENHPVPLYLNKKPQ